MTDTREAVGQPPFCARCEQLRGRSVVTHEIRLGRAVTAYECPSCDWVILLTDVDELARLREEHDRLVAENRMLREKKKKS
jgi:hypothetical protein